MHDIDLKKKYQVVKRNSLPGNDKLEDVKLKPKMLEVGDIEVHLKSKPYVLGIPRGSEYQPSVGTKDINHSQASHFMDRGRSAKQLSEIDFRGRQSNNNRRNTLKDGDITAPIDNKIFFKHTNTRNLKDDYVTGKKIGQGAYGSVIIATHKKSNMIRAIKQIRKRLAQKENEEENLFDEVKILLTLDHPNIVKLFDLYEDNKYYMMVTEYCSGGELFDRIQTTTSFSEKQAASYMRQILSAVVYLHDKGIVHRDLKAENLLFENDSDGSALKLIDFGVSTRMNGTIKMKETLGTPYYIAPEVLLQNYDNKCDVWSCGVLMYILLCGYPPFNGEDDEEIIESVKQGDLVFYDEEWAHISKGAKDLIKMMLKHNPKKRFSAQQALNHSWIQNNAHTTPLKAKIFKNLTSFHGHSRFRHAIITFMASQMVSKKDTDGLMEAFATLDTDGNGVLTRDELIKGYKTVFPEVSLDKIPVIIDDLMDKVDINDEKGIQFTEFAVAAMNREQLLNGKQIKKAFQVFDEDGNGYIDLKELKVAMSGLKLTDPEWKLLILKYDTDHDGVISFTEFQEMLLNISQE